MSMLRYFPRKRKTDEVGYQSRHLGKRQWCISHSLLTPFSPSWFCLALILAKVTCDTYNNDGIYCIELQCKSVQSPHWVSKKCWGSKVECGPFFKNTHLVVINSRKVKERKQTSREFLMEHWALTKVLQLTQLLATLFNSHHNRPHLFMSSSLNHLQVVLQWPTHLFSCGFHCRACYVMSFIVIGLCFWFYLSI